MSDMSSGSPFAELDMQGADMQPLSPVHFINRVAYVFATKTAIAYGARRISYGEFGKRCKQLAAAIIGSGIAPQTTVSVLCPNVPEMLELHFAVPMTGADNNLR